MLDVEFAQLSDPGKSRDHNEDYLGYAMPETPEQARTHGWLFALADEASYAGGHGLEGDDLTRWTELVRRQAESRSPLS